MDLLRSVRRKTTISDFLYIFLNIALAITVYLSVLLTGLFQIGLALLIVSKWRVFAVRPRFWLDNLKTNLVDFIVSISYLIGVWQTFETKAPLFYVIFLVVAYIAWLLFIKPLSSRNAMLLQAGIAAFLGLSTLFNISTNWPVEYVILVALVIGYSSMRHSLSAYDHQENIELYSMISALVFAEICWVGYHWSKAYYFLGISFIKIPQVAIIILLVAFFIERLYRSSRSTHNKVKTEDILIPGIFVVLAIFTMLFLFNDAL